MGYLEYCSSCGARNETLEIEGRKRCVCTVCGTIHYENPKPGVTVVAVRDGRILLVKRGVSPAKGTWGLPGGFMEVRESASEAALRELAEETGLSAEEANFLGICPYPGGVQGDVLILGFTTESVSGHLIPGDDALDARFFPISDLPPVTLKCHREIIRMYLNLSKNPTTLADESPAKGHSHSD